MVDHFPGKGAKFEELETSSLLHSTVGKAGVPSLCRTPWAKTMGAEAAMF